MHLPGWGDRDSVYGFAEDRAGTVWAVGRYGLQRLTGPRPRRFQVADGLAADFLSSVAAAGPGEPWDLIVGYREALGAARVRVEGDRLRLAPLDLSTGREEAGAFAGRILAAVGDRPFELGAGGESLEIRCTALVGWAPFPWFREEPGQVSFEQVLTLADHALYLAKEAGRDQAVGAEPLSSAGWVEPGFWQQPLAEGEGRWVRLSRTKRVPTG